MTIASALPPDSNPEVVQPLQGVASSSIAQTVARLSAEFAATAAERDLLCASGLLVLNIPKEYGMPIASAREQGTGTFVIAALPPKRTGIAVEPDRNNIGQRQTASGSVTFEDVRVELHEPLVWRRAPTPSAGERGNVAVAIAAAKVAGVRATQGDLRLDRHGRNLRTHTLHDPRCCKLRESGHWALKGRHPEPSFHR